MSGISSKAVTNAPENKYKFNEATEFNNTFDISLYETNFRLLDPQVGRFWQIDALDGLSMSQSLYQFARNNPLSRNDKLGLTDLPVTDPNYIHDDKPLPEVVVTSKPKEKNNLLGGWYFAKALDNYTQQQRKQDQYEYQQYGLGNLKQVSQQNQKNFAQWKKADNEWRQMSLGIVCLIVAPVFVATAPEATVGAIVRKVAFSLKQTFALKVESNIANGLADLTSQLTFNGFKFGEVNITSVISNTLIGGNLTGSAITNSLLGSTVNLSFNSVTESLSSGSLAPLGPNSLTNWGANFVTGSIGNRLGSTFGMGLFNDFGSGSFSNYFGNLWGNNVGSTINYILTQ
ncbi:MAG: hypothetical protein KGZ59_03930 [Chitinophagaceae bacterium]|nr:hypothetical protein [Chitinophagaceae bacterium]